MSKFFEQLGQLASSNPAVERLLAAAMRDGLSVAKIPSEIAGDIKRGLAGVGESAAGVLQSGAKLVDDYGPEIRLGEKGGSVSLLDPLNLSPDADEVANEMGYAKAGFGAMSEEPTAAEATYDTMIEAIDGKLRRLQEGGGEPAAPKRAAPKRAAAVEEDMLVEGVPAETPTLEEMQSRNAEFGDSFDFMEGSEDYPAGRAKKSARKVKSRSKRKSKLKGEEPLIATEAGRTIDEIAAPELQVDVSKAAKAEIVSEDSDDYTDQAIALFRNTHGTSFDPKSRMDKGKLEKMRSMLADMGGMGDMTPNQFALQVYRNS